ncbi:MAG: urea ABC transporter permease subunit UrtB [Gammaproteobacteria bacterium]|nr:urea ABC transporter permease subunit UrtB [Gammaproteobacteria bacterium]
MLRILRQRIPGILNASSLFAILLSCFLVNAHAQELTLQQAWEMLTEDSYSDKADAIDAIVTHNPPQAAMVMRTMLQGELYFSKETLKLYRIKELEDGYQFSALLDEEVITQERKRGFKKAKINNTLRGILKQALAGLELNHADAGVRLNAVTELLKEPETESADILRPRVDKEQNEEIRTAMQTLIAIVDLQNEDSTQHLNAIETLGESLNPAALNALKIYTSPDKQLQNAAKRAAQSIRDRKEIYGIFETIFFGLSLGSVLALAAIGLAITFGVMGVINMAHGELIMIGAYTTFVVQQLMPNNIGLSIVVAIPAAFIVSGLVGIAIERGIIRHLYGRPLETLLATFGISLVLQQAVRSIFSPLNRTVETPQWMSGAWQINEVLALTWNRFYIILFCLAVFMALIAIMKKTPLGLQVRAVSQNRTMARAMGVRSDWVDALTFGLGAGIAGIAGVGLSLLTNVGPNLGQAYIIDSFMVVVFGGVGNLWGTLVAGLSLGVANKIMEPWAGAVLAKILVLVFIILFIQKRPKGLFPQRGRAAED